MWDREAVSERRIWSDFIIAWNKLNIVPVDYYDAMVYFYYDRQWGIWRDEYNSQ
jgi:hypothetical protein